MSPTNNYDSRLRAGWRTKSLIATLLICAAATLGRAQAPTRDRAAEWKSLKLPAAEFSRLVDDENGVVLRVPAAWKKETPSTTRTQEQSYGFSGPYSSLLKIVIEKIPSGLPLQSYSAAMLQQLRELPGSGDSLSVRQVAMSGLDAREILFEIPDENGIQTRRLIWCAVDGPVAISIVFIEPQEHIGELEPYLRAVIQSVILRQHLELAGFEATRSNSIKASKPARVDEMESLVENVNGLDASMRAAAVDKLSALLASTPDVCIDLMLDRRPVVRAAVVEAIVGSKNRALDPFLRIALNDDESFVAEPAARALAGAPNAVALLREETLNWLNAQALARVWPFLDRKTKTQILTEGFSRPFQPAIIATRRGAPAKAPRIDYVDPSGELGLLTLLSDIPTQDFKLPWQTIFKAQSDTLTAAALQVGLARGESPSFNDLFRLLASPSAEVNRMAAKHLGETATIANIAQLQDFAKVLSGKIAGSVGTPEGNKTKWSDHSSELGTELQITFKKIRLRNDLNTSTPDQRSKLIADSAKDPQLAEWVWTKYIYKDAPAAEARKITNTITVALLGENAFPKQMTHYVAIPNTANLFDRIGSSLDNLQLDSARAQANLVLVLAGVRRAVGDELGAPFDAPILNYSGIKSDAPISFGSWMAAGAPPGVEAAERKGIVLRVADRDRFERTLGFLQSETGSFSSFPNGAAAVTRFLPLFPAVFPLSANMMFADTPRSHPAAILKIDFNGQTEVDGYPIKEFIAKRVSEKGIVSDDTAYVAYIGDAAVLTPDLASMRDVLERIVGGGATLDENQQFKSYRAAGGEAFYFSDPTELFSRPGMPDATHFNEAGTLQISDKTWESSYHLSFADNSWSKSLLTFSPNDLAAPRELLPRSTLLYYFMKLNAAEMLSAWQTAAPAELKLLSDAAGADLGKEVIPEIDAECGAALLDLPDFSKENWEAHWVLFAKLKSDRLPRAVVEGKLLKGATVTNGVAELKFDSTAVYLAFKHGFLVASTDQNSLNMLDNPQKLAASPDFQKAIARTPASVVAFGAYNLEASSTLTAGGADSVKTQQANLILSLTRAFHSPGIYATLNGDNIEARSSVSMDREGRYSVAELQAQSSKSDPTFAVLRPGGMMIADQNHLDSLRLRIRSKAAGGMDRIAEDLSAKSQTIEKRSEGELQVQVMARHLEPKQKLQLPITAATVAEFITPSKDIPADDNSVAGKAREIAGTDRDAWSVARKLADWTYKNLTWKRVDYADAAQTLATREADCYEFSKLYVAMARSVGLPARVVSGMAYSEGSFGGHAWVEVYVGDWIEIDPTWGTSFVDATHIRDANGALLTYAALNLIQLDVLETPRSVADYQKDPSTLANEICKDTSAGRVAALEAASDVAAVTDELMGAGSWSAMNDKERDEMSAAYSRVLVSLTRWLSGNGAPSPGLRLLKTNAKADRAEALAMSSASGEDDYLKFTLVKRGDAWVMAEVTEVDSGMKMISENLQPTLTEIRERRTGKQAAPVSLTEFARVVVMMQKNNGGALSLAERFLKDNPRSQGLRYLRSLCLANADREKEAAKVWTELIDEQPLVAPALRKLADYYFDSKDDAERNQAVELYKRYISVEPDDPRVHTSLADLYNRAGDVAAAESEYRAALERDQTNSDVYLDLAQFLAERKRFNEAERTMQEGEKHASGTTDLFGDLISRFRFADTTEVPEGLAASEPQRMTKSFTANMNLARIRIDHERAREALPLLRKAASLDSKSSDPFDLISESFRKLREYPAALNAADTAVRLNREDPDAHYTRACALARLGRRLRPLPR